MSNISSSYVSFYLHCLMFFTSCIFFLSILSLAGVQRVSAQASFGLAVPIEVNSTNPKDGDIISSSPKGYILSTTAYDPGLFGVITTNPALSLENIPASPQAHLVISSGNAYVNVSSSNGTINRFDNVTSSSKPGVGVRATDNGYIIGVALESYGNTNTKLTGKILVSVWPHYVGINTGSSRTNLLKNLQTFAKGGYVTPVDLLRYLLAALMTIIAFVLGFIYFGRVAMKGIESLGRNPMAARTIQLSIVLNVLLAVGIIGIGLAISYFILII